MTGYRTASMVTRTLLAFGLLMSGLISSAPASAQVAPSVFFSPTTVAPGGQVAISGSNYDCDVSVTVTLVGNTPPPITLGQAPSLCKGGDFGASFTIPASTPDGFYRVHAADPGGRSGNSDGSLQVLTPAGGTISGTAQCPSTDASFRGGTIQLLSGADVVNTTTASTTGLATYAFRGARPQTTYGIRSPPLPPPAQPTETAGPPSRRRRTASRRSARPRRAPVLIARTAPGIAHSPFPAEPRSRITSVRRTSRSGSRSPSHRGRPSPSE
jgi:hypothetical protein